MRQKYIGIKVHLDQVHCLLSGINRRSGRTACHQSRGTVPPTLEQSVFPGITLGLTAEARESLQTSGQAFPADAAGFSAYYRVGGTGNDRLNKGAIDDYIFKPVGSGSTTLKAGPAVLTAMGANYTVASLPLLNIDGIKSTVNVYYDDEGWVVAYLPKDAPSSQIWQAPVGCGKLFYPTTTPLYPTTA